MLGQPNNHYVFINWLPTAVHTIAGLLVGRLLIANKHPLQKITFAAIALLAIGYALDILRITPIIKPVATSSFVMASLGYCLLILVAFYWWIDIRNHKKHILFFQLVGMNSIFIYLFCDIVGRYWLNKYATVLLGPVHYTLGIPNEWFLVMASVAVFVFEWYICRFLYKKKIFFKI
ncbi:MAG: hypothetical protein Q4G08_11250 [Capnocytophaga sp.]|nr:hypothetical protein [Capnocytophaga sp.]